MSERLNTIYALLGIACLAMCINAGAQGIDPQTGDQIVTGVVTQVGFGKFYLQEKPKEEPKKKPGQEAAKPAPKPPVVTWTLHTGRGTRYEPDNYRPCRGDEVVAYFYDKQHLRRTIQAVSRLKMLKPDPNLMGPPNPAIGTIKEAGFRAFNVYVPEIKKAHKFEIARGWRKIPRRWDPMAGDRVQVTYKKVASRFTGNVVYQIVTMEKLENSQ